MKALSIPKRQRGVLLIFALLLLTCLWLCISPARVAPIQATLLYHTNADDGRTAAVFKVENRSSRDFNFTLRSEQLVAGQWAFVASSQDRPGPTGDNAGWL